MKLYTKAFKAQFPSISVEGIMCYALVAGSAELKTVGKIAESAGISEPTAYKELASLSSGAGPGLVAFINMGDGRNQVQLTPRGADFRDALQKQMGL